MGTNWQDEKQWEQPKIQEIPLNQSEHYFYSKGGQTLEQVAQKDSGISIPWEFKALSKLF